MFLEPARAFVGAHVRRDALDVAGFRREVGMDLDSNDALGTFLPISDADRQFVEQARAQKLRIQPAERDAILQARKTTQSGGSASMRTTTRSFTTR